MIIHANRKTNYLQSDFVDTDNCSMCDINPGLTREWFTRSNLLCGIHEANKLLNIKYTSNK